MNELKDLLVASGASLVGFSDLAPVPEANRAGMQYGVSIAVALEPATVMKIIEGPTMDYFNDYARANRLLSELGIKAVQFLSEKGCGARLVVPTTEGYNRETDSVVFQHKTAATRAGLGWIGKCALLVTREYGSAVRLVTVLTDGNLTAGEPVEVSRCGACTLCVEQCPAHAPSGREWKVGMEREAFFKASRCKRKARELSAKIGLQKTICGICIAACPWTQRYIEKRN